MGSSGNIIAIKEDQFIDNWSSIKEELIDSFNHYFNNSYFFESNYKDFEYLLSIESVTKDNLHEVISKLHHTEIWDGYEVDTEIFGLPISSGEEFPQFHNDYIFLYETDQQDWRYNILPLVVACIYDEENEEKLAHNIEIWT